MYEDRIKGIIGSGVCIIISVILSLILRYIFVVPLYLKSGEFWSWIIISFLILCISTNIFASFFDEDGEWFYSHILWGIFSFLIIFTFILSLCSWKGFHAKEVANILKVDEGSVEDIPDSEDSNTLFLTDTSSAKRLCTRVLGAKAEEASQYKVGKLMTINYQGKTVKVAPLAYSNFWKWNNNHTNGIPAYIIVQNDEDGKPYATRIQLEQGMKYVPSAAFGEKLRRYLQYKYPHYLLDSAHFEIDEDGNPYYITPVLKHTISFFGGTDVFGAILTNPIDGESEYYSLKEVPTWVDCVVDGDRICKQYDNYGTLQNGFWNSIFGQRGCVKSTEDYGYLSKDGDIYIFSGVTSVIGDSSNIGFIMANERTKEVKYITCDGADEVSAMGAAEGEVQNMQYEASFPSLIRVGDNAAYIMALKDKNGLTKQFAVVSVKDYSKVALAAIPTDAAEGLDKLLSGEISEEEAKSIKDDSTEEEIDDSEYVKQTITITAKENITYKGDSYLYLVDENGDIHIALYAQVPEYISAKVGDTVDIWVKGNKFIGKNFTYDILPVQN